MTTNRLLLLCVSVALCVKAKLNLICKRVSIVRASECFGIVF